MATITKNMFSNQFSISFPVTSCYLLKMTKDTHTPIWSRVLALAQHYSSSELPGALCISSLLETVTTGEYRLQTGSHHIAFKRLLNVY